MKQLTFGATVLCLSLTSFADEVPQAYMKMLKPFQLTSVQLSDGALKVTMGFPKVNPQMFEAISVGAFCPPLYDDNAVYGLARIDRLEVLNEIGKQGFALENPIQICVEYGQLDVKGGKELIAERTLPCAAGYCRRVLQ